MSRQTHDKKVVVLAVDRKDAQDRWRRKGWTLVRAMAGKPARGHATVELHFQRTTGKS